MLDHVSISHQSGLVLWSRSYTPAFTSIANTASSPVNALIREAFIEGKVQNEETGFERDGYNVRWTVENGFGLVFVVVFPALLPLTYIPTLLNRTKQLFIALFQPVLETLLRQLDGSVAGIESALHAIKEHIVIERWDKIFERCLRNCEGGDKNGPARPSTPHMSRLAPPPTDSPGPSSDAETSLTAEEIAKNVQALKSRIKGGRGPRGSLKGVGAGAGGSNGVSPAASPRKTGAAAKLMRKWDNAPVTAADMAALDYSAPAPDDAKVNTEGLVSGDAMGIRKDGMYEVAEWDFGRRGSAKKSDGDLPSEEEILTRGTSKMKISDEKEEAEETSAWTGIFSRLTGSKVLTKQDLAPVLAEMERNLMDKNVAKDIAEKICEGVGAALVGQKLAGLTSVKSKVQDAISSSLTRVLTPKTSTDILLDIQRKRAASLSALSTTTSSKPEPYALTFVGVNGVGKSTNLSKVCFWLLQNGLRVLIAACDTFRSGAVEQLRVHVRNLGALQDEMAPQEGQKGNKVELYERGYGKDAAGIAKDAIAYAKEEGFDVVLIDTAGRMQDNEPLMRALAKLVTVNNPDKIVFVGEALVGNEAVDQLTKFDRSLKDFSAAGIGGAQRKRGIDGIILTKFDTIDDKVGAALSMTYVTGQPILFVGCGQTYTDLRHLRVNHIVQALLA